MKISYTILPQVFFILIVCVFLISSCGIFNSDGDEGLQGDWKEIASFEGIPRSEAVAFSINGKGYVGTGYNNEQDDEDDRLKDFWQYDSEQNFWIQMADFPGTPRSSAVGFVAGGKGYIGTGYNDDIKDYHLKDFWAYDPATNSWDSVAAFGGSARYGAVSFSIDDMGYVGTGNDFNDLKDFWRYNPKTDQWDQIVSLPGDKRINATAFVIDGKAYVGTGRNNGVYEDDFYMYDPQSELWTRLHNLDEDEDGDDQNIPRSRAIGFSLNGKGFITLGETNGNHADIWEFDPTTNAWSDKNLADFEGIPRRDAVVFTIGNIAYVGTGTAGSSPYDDFWEYDPTIENDESTY